MRSGCSVPRGVARWAERTGVHEREGFTAARAQAQLLVESAGAMKSRVAREGAFAMLAAVALRHGQLEAVAGALVAALPRNEHLGAALPELAAYAEGRHGDASLVGALRTA